MQDIQFRTFSVTNPDDLARLGFNALILDYWTSAVNNDFESMKITVEQFEMTANSPSIPESAINNFIYSIEERTCCTFKWMPNKTWKITDKYERNRKLKKYSIINKKKEAAQKALDRLNANPYANFHTNLISVLESFYEIENEYGHFECDPVEELQSLLDKAPVDSLKAFMKEQILSTMPYMITDEYKIVEVGEEPTKVMLKFAIAYVRSSNSSFTERYKTFASGFTNGKTEQVTDKGVLASRVKVEVYGNLENYEERSIPKTIGEADKVEAPKPKYTPEEDIKPEDLFLEKTKAKVEPQPEVEPTKPESNDFNWILEAANKPKVVYASVEEVNGYINGCSLESLQKLLRKNSGVNFDEQGLKRIQLQILELKQKDKAIFSEKGATSKTRKHQATFAKMTRLYYDDKCALTGFGDVPELLEAAHVRPVGEKHGGQNTVKNCILMERSIHRMFDLFMFTINPETKTVEISDRLVGTMYESLNGKQLIDISADNENLQYHYNLYMEKNLK